MMTPQQIAKLIDHTILKPETTVSMVERVAAEARQYGFASVCVNPWFVPRVAKLLEGTDIDVTTVIGFPLGATTSSAKAFEAEEALRNGATEFDMVLNVGLLKSGDYRGVVEDIRAVKQAVGDRVLKVILETALLTPEEIAEASRASVEAGADFVKTSTGFGPGGATVEAVRIMRETVGPDFGVKASGGIRTLDTLLAMVKAGANRIGASSSVAIMEEALARSGNS